jgi:DNA-binding response OmpR family regulator
VSRVLLLTSTRESAAEILPSLSLLDHAVTVAPASSHALRGRPAARSQPVPGGAGTTRTESAAPDAVLVDARQHLLSAKELVGQLAAAGIPILAIISEGAWAAITAEWGVDDVVLHTAGPGEVEARIRLAIGRTAAPASSQVAEVRSGELVIDEETYSAKIRGVALDLTFKEFELLKFLAQHPRRVFTRSQLLAEVWGYEYFGGTRTVDVHVRRLRAKLGSENEALIGTVRNVGYKFVPARSAPAGSEAHEASEDKAPGSKAPPATAEGARHPGARAAGPRSDNGRLRASRQDEVGVSDVEGRRQ